MSIQPGQQLLHYRLIEKIGEGGMGVVWRALDTTLDREVAVKFLPAAFANDTDRLTRFEREAKLLASLNHPNIAGVFGLHQADGENFLAMECIAGEDLAERLRRGPLPIDSVLDIAGQITEALEAAHDSGVVHRDLKPANVRLTPEGRVKVLDFGLAKAFLDSADPTASPTLTSAGTREGLILGTAQYMSPEQARGRPVEKHTDIFSFGCVLYECLTGRRAFGGETVTDTLASILKTDADWSALPIGTPPRIRELLARCLEKDPRNRLRDIGDARFELNRARTDASSTSGAAMNLGTAGLEMQAPTEPARRPRIEVGVAALIGVALGATIWALVSTFIGPMGAAPGGLSRFSVNFPSAWELRGEYAITPDGKSLLLAGSSGDSEDAVRSIYTRRLDDFTLRKIAGTDGALHAIASPDSAWLAIVAPTNARSKQLTLSKVRVDGAAPPQPLIDWQPDWSHEAVWTPDDEILTTTTTTGSEALIRIPTNGSVPEPPVEIRANGRKGGFNFDHGNYAVLPDRLNVLGVFASYGESGYEVSVAVVNIETGELKVLIENGQRPNYIETGHILFSRGGTLLAVPFDVDALRITGAQVAITDGLRADAVWEDANYSLSRNGTLVYEPGGVVGGSRKLVYIDPDYSVVGPWSDDRRPFEARMVISPDGRRLAVVQVNPGGLYEIWVSDVDRPRLTQLVQIPGRDARPLRFSSDGKRLVYSVTNPGAHGLEIRAGDGSDEPETLLEWSSESENYSNVAFLNDTTLIVTHSLSGNSELMLLPLAPDASGKREPTTWLENASTPRVSPDGGWLSYSSHKSGRGEIYIRRLESDGALGREHPVSRRGCGAAWWARGPGTAPLQLRMSCDATIYTTTITTTPDVIISHPKRVADVGELQRRFRGSSDQLPDGRYIAIMQGDDEELPRELSIVLNWFDELRARLEAAH